jgi:hypothetical protein
VRRQISPRDAWLALTAVTAAELYHLRAVFYPLQAFIESRELCLDVFEIHLVF